MNYDKLRAEYSSIYKYHDHEFKVGGHVVTMKQGDSKFFVYLDKDFYKKWARNCLVFGLICSAAFFIISKGSPSVVSRLLLSAVPFVLLGILALIYYRLSKKSRLVIWDLKGRVICYGMGKNFPMNQVRYLEIRKLPTSGRFRHEVTWSYHLIVITTMNDEFVVFSSDSRANVLWGAEFIADLTKIQLHSVIELA